MISTISCLLEDNNKTASRVVRHINTMISTAKSQIDPRQHGRQNMKNHYESDEIRNLVKILPWPQDT